MKMNSDFVGDFTFDNLIDPEAYGDNDEPTLGPDPPLHRRPQPRSPVLPADPHAQTCSHSQTTSALPTQQTLPWFSTATVPARDEDSHLTTDPDSIPDITLGGNDCLAAGARPVTKPAADSATCLVSADARRDPGPPRWERPRSVSPRRWRDFGPNHQRALVHAHRINGPDGEDPRFPCAQCVRDRSVCRVYTVAARTRHWVRGGESCSVCYEKHRQCSFVTRGGRGATERRLREFHRRPESEGEWFSVRRESWEDWGSEGRNGKERLRRFAQVGRIEEVAGEGEDAAGACDRCVARGYACRVFTAEAQRRYCLRSARVCSRCTFSMSGGCNASVVVGRALSAL